MGLREAQTAPGWETTHVRARPLSLAATVGARTRSAAVAKDLAIVCKCKECLWEQRDSLDADGGRSLDRLDLYSIE